MYGICLEGKDELSFCFLCYYMVNRQSPSLLLRLLQSKGPTVYFSSYFLLLEFKKDLKGFYITLKKSVVHGFYCM